jgi:hypothetical protein
MRANLSSYSPVFNPAAAEHYDYALQALREISYNKWREYDHEDAVRFYSLRLREAGIVKSMHASSRSDQSGARPIEDRGRQARAESRND